MNAPLSALLGLWVEQLRARAYAPAVVARRHRDAQRFVAWCANQGVASASALTPALVSAYGRALAAQRDVRGRLLSVLARDRRLGALRGFAVWLVASGAAMATVAAAVPSPLRRTYRERSVLTRAQVAQLLAVPDPTTPDGVRNRALLEVLYSTGLRRSECSALRLGDVPPGQGLVRVERGKGGRGRLVPLGARAAAWVGAFLREGRPALAGRSRQVSDALWLTDDGMPFEPDHLSALVRASLDAIGVAQGGACHRLRHAFATHLLEAGAEVAAIGAMLGHRGLRATPIYTHVDADALAAAVAAARRA